MTKTKKEKEFKYISTAIQDYHNDRLKRYAKAVNRKEGIVTTELIIMHRAGINIAQHISHTIGEDHEQYTIKLENMGENSIFIR